MENDFWLNLASKDLKKAREFYQAIGFVINDSHGVPDMVSLFVGKGKTVLNLFPERTLLGFAGQAVSDSSQATEVVLSLGASSRSEVDAISAKVVEAGGSLYGKPGEKDGWMYGCGFADPDGHRWSVVYMDMSRLPKRP